MKILLLHTKRTAAFWVAALFLFVKLSAQEGFVTGRFIHGFGMEVRSGYIFPTNKSLEGGKMYGSYYNPIKSFNSLHLKYSFRLRPGTVQARTFLDAYQGIGVGQYLIVNGKQDHRTETDPYSQLNIGNPTVAYLFQGGKIAGLSSHLSLNYEWNFGLSFGWKPYDPEYNELNILIGSKVNFYMNAAVNLQYALSRRWDLQLGISGTHFSNGNTRQPNAGLNAVDAKLGIAYNFNRTESEQRTLRWEERPALSPFVRYLSYDLTLWGAWRKKIVMRDWGADLVPGTFGVAGFNFAPMYNLGYKYRVGLSLDGTFDGSANVYYDEGYNNYYYSTRSFIKHVALGASVRGEFVMPYFSINIGVGRNLFGSASMKYYYQTLTLKIDLLQNSYLNVGYSLRDFHEPNHLMLGIGYRFYNRRFKL